jgi:hypothetical protein
MKRNRPAFGFQLAIVAIVIISLVILGLIYMLNTIDNGYNPYITTEASPTQGLESVDVKKNELSYLDRLENYHDVDTGEVSQDEAKEENSASLVSRKSEASKNSISTLIDNVVNNALPQETVAE